MTQDSTGTYVAAADYDRAVAELHDLGRQVIDNFKSVERGEISAQEAIAKITVLARLKGLKSSSRE